TKPGRTYRWPKIPRIRDLCTRRPAFDPANTAFVRPTYSAAQLGVRSAGPSPASLRRNPQPGRGDHLPSPRHRGEFPPWLDTTHFAPESGNAPTYASKRPVSSETYATHLVCCVSPKA